MNDIIGKNDPEAAALVADPAAAADAIKNNPEKWKKWALLGIIPALLALAYMYSQDNKEETPSAAPAPLPPTPADAVTPEATQEYLRSCAEDTGKTPGSININRLNQPGGIKLTEAHRESISKEWLKTEKWNTLQQTVTANGNFINP